MPWPLMAYMTNAMTTSCQPSPHPQATGTAATTAKNGTAMKIASSTCSIRAWVSVPGTYASGLAAAVLAARAALPARVEAVAAALPARARATSSAPLAGLDEGAVWASVVMKAAPRARGRRTYATVTYVSVGWSKGSGRVATGVREQPLLRRGTI